MIPLSLSSTISFNTGPIFAAILAFILIGENLSNIEILVILFSIIGTTMLTMPHWFIFLGIEMEELRIRYNLDILKYS
jgi:drug/metabolite transporter (DMT)-like permease